MAAVRDIAEDYKRPRDMKRVTRVSRVAADLRGAHADGEFAAGDRLPREADLASNTESPAPPCGLRYMNWKLTGSCGPSTVWERSSSKGRGSWLGSSGWTRLPRPSVPRAASSE